jgi:single-stranded-DNA-specific exonuclease
LSNLSWKYKDIKTSPEIEEIAGSKVIAQILLNRGLDTKKKVLDFLSPEKLVPQKPDVFCDMKKSVDRIVKAIKNSEHIVIFGDFDCDGVTSTVLLYKTLKYLKANVSYYIPDRESEGHGLNSKAIITLISKESAKLIITVDNGVSDIVEVKLAQSFGVDVIITDHHEAPEEMPEAFAIIDPKAPHSLDENLEIEKIEDLQNLAGVGVAYKLALGLLKHYKKEDFAQEILYLVTIGTIADVVPLLGENRHYVKKGLELMSQNPPMALIKLFKSAGVKVDKITADTIAFALAPRINAAGRLEHANLAVEFFTEEDAEKIDSYIQQLNNHNQNRQQLCDTTFMEAEFKIKEEIDLNKNKGIVLFDENWHAGIIGIVASRLVEKYQRPAFLITLNRKKDQARSSARSLEGFHLYETLKELSDMLGHFGGHAGAAGFSFDLNSTNLKDFTEALNNKINEKLEETPLSAYLNIDAEIGSDELNFDFIEKLNLLAPFGSANPSPVLGMSNLELKQFYTMGSGNNHLKMFLEAEKDTVFEAVWWNKGEIEAQVLEKLNVAFSPRINSFNQKTTLQLEVKDIKLVNPPVSKEIEPELSLKQPIWLDHRGKVNIFKSVNNYLKTTNNTVAVFVEDKEILKTLENYNEIHSKIVNRLGIFRANEVMFFDYPTDNGLLKSIIELAEPEKIHLMPFNLKNFTISEIIKTVSGMLKYAHAQKDGMVYLDEIASILSISNNSLTSCIKLLDSSNIIEITNLNEELCEFSFIQGKELNYLINLPEYKDFENTLTQTQNFQHDLCNKEISEIQLFLR